MNEDKIIIYTQAYRAEKTLQRTINSVLAQTYQNWLWFIIDNGSDDGTGMVLANAALNDCRIIPCRINNNTTSIAIPMWLLLKEHFKDAYFMHLDADDTLEPECLERLFAFIKKENLKIAACGTRFKRVEADGTESIVRTRCLESDLVIEGEGYATEFTKYRPFTNEWWGKLYHMSVISKEGFFSHIQIHNDSVSALHFFAKAKRVGILSECLHNAYVSDGSLKNVEKGLGSLNWVDAFLKKPKNIKYLKTVKMHGDALIEYKEFLKQYGEISPENMDYLYAIYFGWIHESLISCYLGIMGDYTEYFYIKLHEVLDDEVFSEAIRYRKNTDKYSNLAKRKGVLRQMYYVVLASTYWCYSSLFPKMLMTKIDELSMEAGA